MGDTKKFNKLILIVCTLVCVWGFSVMNAGAAPAHVHQKNLSPFEKSDVHAQHLCPLKHSPTQPCPHRSMGALIAQIGPDCGGKPAGQIPSSVSFNKQSFSSAAWVVAPKSPPHISVFLPQPDTLLDSLFAETPKPPPRVF